MKNLISFFTNLFRKTPSWKKDSKSPIEFAFRANGVDYYQYPNPFNIPYQRGLMGIAIYEEFNMRLTKDFLKLSLEAMKEELSGKKGEINMVNVVNHVRNIEDRMDWVIEIDTVYKLASVVFFDESESPYTYDPIYNKKKIELWKKNKVSDFFLSLPLKDLIPFLTASQQDMQTYLGKVQRHSLMHIEQLQKVLSKEEFPSYSEELLRLKTALKELEI